MDEEVYFVSIADCVIVEENSLPTNDVMLAEIIDCDDEADSSQGSHVNEAMEYQVAQLCLPPKISTSALYTAIEEKHWEQACDLMDYCENECLFKFEEKWNGWTALHKACFHRSIPIEFFHDLLDLTLKANDGVLVKDKWGDTALHLACQHSTDEMILLLLENCPSATCVKNKHGGLPLHTAVHYECTRNILHRLLEANPEAIHVQNNYDNTPLHNFLHSQKFIYAPIIRLPDSIPLYGGDHVEICFVLVLLLQASQNFNLDESSSHDSFLLLHSALDVNAPIDFITLILDNYKKEFCEFDHAGNMPIHIAVALKDKEYRSNILKLFVSKYSDCLRIPNREGRLPIAILLQTNPSHEILSYVFKACVFVCDTRDTITHLHPFLFALCSLNGKSSTLLPSDVESEEEELLDDNASREELLRKMTNSYMILMENPAVFRESEPIN